MASASRVLLIAAIAAAAGAATHLVLERTALALPPWLATLVAVAVSLLLFVLFLPVVLGPLRRISATLERAREGEWSIRADPTLAGEAGRLAQQVNELLVAMQRERAQADTALAAATGNTREAEARLRMVYEASPIGLWEWVPGQERFHTSAAAKRLLGDARTDRDDLESFLARVHAEDVDRVRLGLADLAEGRRRGVDVEFRVREMGAGVWLALRGEAARDATGAARAAGALVDLSESRRLQNALADAQARLDATAQAAAQAQAEVLRRVGERVHEAAEAARSNVQALVGARPGPQRAVRQETEPLVNIARTLLDHAQLESDQVPLDNDPFEVRHVVEEAVERAAALAHAKGLELVYEVDPAVPLKVVGDDDRLRRILLHLLDNALRYTDTGEVVLSVGARSQGVDRAELLFWVKDTGPGLRAEEAQQLFSPFVRLDGRPGGLGLGLSVARRLLERMGGRLNLETSPGRGTTFLAAFAADVVPTPAPRPPPARLTGRRLLIIDDHATARRILAREAARAGLIAVECATVPEAITHLAGEAAPDLVLLDDRLPRHEPAEVVAAIRERPQGRAVPIVLLGRLRDEEEVRSLGADDALHKPVRPHRMLESLAGLLDRQAFVGSPELVKTPAPAAAKMPALPEVAHLEDPVIVRPPTAPPTPATPAMAAPKPKRRKAEPSRAGTGTRSKRPATLDARTVARLRSQLGHELATQRLLSYVEQSSTMLAEVRGAIATGDAAALADASDRLAAASRDIGARRMAEAAAQLEALAGRGTVDGAFECIRELESAHRHTRQAIDVERARSPG
jgi:PAS domain S-box-containing protein